jgi:hypothetical protein
MAFTAMNTVALMPGKIPSGSANGVDVISCQKIKIRNAVLMNAQKIIMVGVLAEDRNVFSPHTHN